MFPILGGAIFAVVSRKKWFKGGKTRCSSRRSRGDAGMTPDDLENDDPHWMGSCAGGCFSIVFDRFMPHTHIHTWGRTCRDGCCCVFRPTHLQNVWTHPLVQVLLYHTTRVARRCLTLARYSAPPRPFCDNPNTSMDNCRHQEHHPCLNPYDGILILVPGSP
jgi:hypothetical protein